ncbi:MAG: hypothetical protein MI923_25770 [Phycisphaerales bacterium]|nr:hypothetical protein [Phycisphaerales bacterium]
MSENVSHQNFEILFKHLVGRNPTKEEAKEYAQELGCEHRHPAEGLEWMAQKASLRRAEVLRQLVSYLRVAMPNNEGGRRFENQVRMLLEGVRWEFPNYVNVKYQPRIELHNGEIVIPDFEFAHKTQHAVFRYLIECQDRKRSSNDVADKIRKVKSLSSWNLFLFIHNRPIPKPLKKALDADGVNAMSFEGFANFMSNTKLTLYPLAGSQLDKRRQDELPEIHLAKPQW